MSRGPASLEQRAYCFVDKAQERHDNFGLSSVLAAGNFGIVEPFPTNIYAVEFTSGQVTCVAFDSTGLKNPQEILFVRKNRFAEYTILKADDRLYFTNYTVEVVKGT